MKKVDGAKEKIIEAAVGLINESEGDAADINTRAIAERAGVGVGLINYHFQTKENLLEICVERIIGEVIAAFNPPYPPAAPPLTRAKSTAKLVFDFLVDHPAVSRISILSDLKNPQPMDNTMRSAMGIQYIMGGLDLPERERSILAFALVSAMQALFLRREQSGALFGYDINRKEQRDGVLDLLVENLLGGLPVCRKN